MSDSRQRLNIKDSDRGFLITVLNATAVQHEYAETPLELVRSASSIHLIVAVGCGTHYIRRSPDKVLWSANQC